MTSRRRQCLAEGFGTFAIVFAGTGAIVINDVSGGAVTHVGISLTFGLIVLAMIYALGDVSGCHLNPAVTLGFCAAGRFPARSVPSYLASQSLGALAASLTLKGMFPEHATLGATVPAGGPLQAFLMEAILTWILMTVVLRVSVGARETGAMAGVAVGAVIALEALFGGPVSGASMNPARSLAPAIVSRQLGTLWIYIAAPILGALAGVALDRAISEPPLEPVTSKE